jgi:hypothetical protein
LITIPVVFATGRQTRVSVRRPAASACQRPLPTSSCRE